MNAAEAKKQSVAWPIARERSEWWFVWGVIIVVLVITTLPYLFAYSTTPPDKQYMGIMVNIPDHMQYFSWMQQFSTAHLAANKLTPEANEPVFFNLLWWGMARLDNLLGLGYAGMFQLLRVVSIISFFLLAYHVCSWFLADRRMRQVAFLLIVFAGGFGWMLVIIKYLLGLPDVPQPLLLYVSEPNTFFNALAFPHFLAAALYIWVFDLILRGEAKNQLRYAVAAGLWALFLGWQHAYDLVLVYGMLGAYGLLRIVKERALPMYLVKSGLIIGLISWWPALYSVLLTSLDPLWQEVLAQFDNADVFTPNPLGLVVLMGPILLLALIALVKDNPFKLQQMDNNTLFLKSWFVANFFLLYIPTDYQIHMLNGWQVPMAILATQALFWYIIPMVQRWFTPRWSTETVQRGVIVACLVLVIPTNIYLVAWRFIDLGRHDYPFFLQQSELSAMDWLEDNVQPDDVILSSLTTGQFLPAYTGAHAFLAHWAQTVDFFNKRAMAYGFFGGNLTDEQRRNILTTYGVDYIFYGPVEQNVGSYAVNESPLLEPVYDEAGVSIYRVALQD